MATNGMAVGSHMTPGQLEELVGWRVGSVTAVAWLLIQEMAKGSSPELVAKGLGVTEKDLQDIVDQTTGLTGPESQSAWNDGMIVLKTASRLNSHAVDSSWEAVEALAITKLHGSMAAMGSNGDPDTMLKIAMTANKAIRRGRGEGNGSGGASIHLNSEGGISATIKSGNLGFISLQLSPAIRNQIQKPEKVIDGDVIGRSATAPKLSMLNLEETRQAGDTGELDKNAKQTAALRDMFKDFADK